jgi:primosomal protein N' (replication factor Y)
MKLTLEQQQALTLIEQKQFTLLHGVTGSGKTEVYLQAAQKAVAAGKQVIVLVPEISLTPQTTTRFAERFPIAILHSRLTPKEKHLSWQKIIAGEVPVVVGARSALFAPCHNLGLIIIDEEHDSSYKQDNNPRYQAVITAEERAKLTGAKLILGTATPSLETYYRYKDHPDQLYGYIQLTKRINDYPMPPVEIVDLREELHAGNFSVLSRRLREKIKDRLERKEKIIIFLNRRGFSTFVSCRSCGYVLECPRCSVSLTYHQDETAHCHYCDHIESVPNACPKCGSKYFRFFGTGTQKVEAELQKYFGAIKTLRMDKDTTQKRESHQDILHEFIHSDADVLLGTQMIAKGHDFPEVTLVGIIAADSILHLPDFRASERTFQLLAQVAGRTGRGVKGGEVIVQTYNPDHIAIQAAAKHDYELFFKHELADRKAAQYPPFTKLTMIVVSAPEENLVKKRIMEVAKQFPSDRVLGPVPCPLRKLRGFYRWQILLKDCTVNYSDFPEESDVKIEIDVDPVNML